MKNVLFFSPYQLIYQHAFVERRIAEVLQQDNNFRVNFLGCGGIYLPFCHPIGMHGLDLSSKRKHEICNECQKFRKKTWKEKEKNILENYITTTELKEIEQDIEKLDINNFTEFEKYGFRIGRIACYDVILKCKIPSFETQVSPESYELFKVSIRNTLVTYLSVTRYLTSNQIDHVVVYNSDYSVNHMLYEVARKLKIPTSFIHGSIEYGKIYDSFYISNSLPENFLREKISFFEANHQKFNFPTSLLSRVKAQIQQLLDAKHFFVYSAPKKSIEDTMTKLGLSLEDKIVLMSFGSQDESFATDFSVLYGDFLGKSEGLFKDQFEWLRHAIAFFTKHPEWKLLIRLHPREFPNKREKRLAPIVKKYAEILESLPPNILVVDPAQQVSIYDIFPIAHLHLTSWSSVGLESALLGIPTIATTRFLSLYSTKYVNEYVNDIESYETKVSFWLNKRDRVISLDAAKRGCEYLIYDYEFCTIDLPAPQFWNFKPSFFIKVARKLRIISNKNIFTYKSYRKQSVVPSDQAKLIINYFETLEPIYVQKTKGILKSSHSNETDFKNAVQNELSEFWNTDLRTLK